jgi:integrase
MSRFMAAIDYRYLARDRDRHNNVRWYVRKRPLPKIRLKSEPGTAEFDAEYRAALAQLGGATEPVTRERTWRWLVESYLRSAEHKALHESTQKQRLRVLQETLREPRKPGAPEVIGDMPLSRMDERVIAILRDRKAGLPEAANIRVKAIRRVFAWAKDSGLVTVDPSRDVRRVRTSSQGFHVWTEAEIERFKERHPLGTKPHLALMIMLLTGVRRSDAVRLGRQHERKMADGSKMLVFTATKNKLRKPMRIEIPLLPELQKVLDASKIGDLTYLVTDYGRAFSEAGFGNRMREWCDQAGLPECSSHGLRKAAATAAAENGASTSALQAMFGWMSVQQAELYTRTAERRKLAVSNMALVVRR